MPISDLQRQLFPLRNSERHVGHVKLQRRLRLEISGLYTSPRRISILHFPLFRGRTVVVRVDGDRMLLLLLLGILLLGCCGRIPGQQGRGIPCNVFEK